MMPNAIRRVLAVAAAALAGFAAPGAGAAPKASCTIEPFDYTVASSIVGGRLAYVAEGTAVLGGERCPVRGRTVHVRETVDYAVDATGKIAGRYVSRWSDATGHLDLMWQGRVTVASSDALDGAGSGSFTQVVHAHGPGGAQLRIEQAGTIDLGRDHPLTGLSCRCGVIAIPIGS